MKKSDNKVRMSFMITEKQDLWIKKNSEKYNVSQGAIIRDAIEAYANQKKLDAGVTTRLRKKVK